MSTPSVSDVDLLLVGKTGNGKSATGNSILRRKAFKASSNLSSETVKVSWEVSKYNELVLKVVDGPGLGDTRLTEKDGLEMFMNAMEYAVMSNPQGYHAFLLVVRYGTRFTQEDIDTVVMMKRVFGENFVRDYCVMVMTCGDNFDVDAEETGETFEQWCQQQKGYMQELMRECQGRIVLFDNETKDETKRARQLDALLSMVNHLKFSGKRYSDENFRRAEQAREKVRVESKRPMIQESTMCKMSLILQRLTEIQRRSFSDPQHKERELGNLKQEVQALIDNIAAEDKGTGALKEITKNASSILNTVQEAILSHQRIEQERREVEAMREEARRNAEQARINAEREEARQRGLELEREAREREQRLAVARRDDQTRLEGMTTEINDNYVDLRVRIDLNIIQEMINFTKGLLVKGVNGFLEWLSGLGGGRGGRGSCF